MVRKEAAYEAVERNLSGSRPKELFQVGAAILEIVFVGWGGRGRGRGRGGRRSQEPQGAVPCGSRCTCLLVLNPLHSLPLHQVQDVLEEMEEEYDRQKAAVKEAMRAKDIQVGIYVCVGGVPGWCAWVFL